MEVTCIDPYTLTDFLISIVEGFAIGLGALTVLGLTFYLAK